jgi:NitT/TauT family transport system substrate-binding protein
VRVIQNPSICLAPQYVAEELLRAEGFADVRYVSLPARICFEEALGHGEADFSLQFALIQVQQIDAGAPITILAGVIVGCFELFASTTVRSLMELKGKRIGLKASPPDLLALMAARSGSTRPRTSSWSPTPRQPV